MRIKCVFYSSIYHLFKTNTIDETARKVQWTLQDSMKAFFGFEEGFCGIKHKYHISNSTGESQGEQLSRLITSTLLLTLKFPG